MTGLGSAELGLAPSAGEFASLRGEEAVSVLRLAQRQKNSADAVRMAALVEVGVRGFESADTVERMAAPDRWSGHEIRAALAVSEYAANDQLDLAWTVVRRFPQMYAAMAAGELDESRARVIARWVKDMSDENAAIVVDDVLGRCSIDHERPYTPEALSDRCKKLGIALDPDWALRAFTEALKRKRVYGHLNDDGTANLTAQNQDPARVAGSKGRVKRLAAAARRAGDPRTLDELESELFLGLLDGTYATTDDDAVLRALAGTRPQDDPTGEPSNGTDTGEHGDLIDLPDLPDPAEAPAGDSAGPGSRVRLQDRVAVTAKLSTLLGLDRHPADLAGWGPIHAEYTRELVQRLSAGQWRYAVLDENGHPIRSGLTPARPTGWDPRNAANAGIVDLLIPADLLQALTEGPLAHGNLADPGLVLAWMPVIEDIARRADGTALGNGRPGPDPHDPTEARRRFARAGMRRELQLAIPTCIGVGCRRPSIDADLDHTRDHALGGDTITANLGPACGPDHALKTKGGWRLRRLNEHTFRWTSRLGRTYDVAIAPLIDDLPPPGRSGPRQAPCPTPDEPRY